MKPSVKKVYIEAPLYECLQYMGNDGLSLRETEFTAFVADHIPYVCLDSKGYENLSLNMQDIMTHVRNQHIKESFYRNCITKMIEHQESFKRDNSDAK